MHDREIALLEEQVKDIVASNALEVQLLEERVRGTEKRLLELERVTINIQDSVIQNSQFVLKRLQQENQEETEN